jgi:hypothetical protein
MDSFENIDKNVKCCFNCQRFDIRTHFCRLRPPVPILFPERNNEETKVSSKFPVITKPYQDYCEEGFKNKA